MTGEGSYSAFPDNLQIDPLTGKITVAVMGKGGESQTGLRYKIMFQPAGSANRDSTFIVIGVLAISTASIVFRRTTLLFPLFIMPTRVCPFRVAPMASRPTMSSP